MEPSSLAKIWEPFYLFSREIIMWEFRTGALEPEDLILNLISFTSWPLDLEDFIENVLKIILPLQY